MVCHFDGGLTSHGFKPFDSPPSLRIPIQPALAETVGATWREKGKPPNLSHEGQPPSKIKMDDDRMIFESSPGQVATALLYGSLDPICPTSFVRSGSWPGLRLLLSLGLDPPMRHQSRRLCEGLGTGTQKGMAVPAVFKASSGEFYNLVHSCLQKTGVKHVSKKGQHSISHGRMSFGMCFVNGMIQK